MRLSSFCMNCLENRQFERVHDFEDDNKKSEYLKQVAKIIGTSDDDDSAPALVYLMNQEFIRIFGPLKDYAEIKHDFNKMMLEIEDDIRKSILQEEDPLRTALQYARVGNYIDFGAAGNVKKDELVKLIEVAKTDPIDEDNYNSFIEDLKTASSLVYFTDNCGEIVMDKLCIETLKKQYPNLKVHVIVRGEDTINDATMEDAIEIGLTELTNVVSNGNGVAGTDLKLIQGEPKKLIEQADLLISKGQGNFETLHGCGLNIYYSFLCKCEMFTKRFGMERYKGVFLKESGLEEIYDN